KKLAKLKPTSMPNIKPTDEVGKVKREIEALNKEKDRARKETQKQISKEKGFRKFGLQAQNVARQALLNKQINQKRSFLKKSQQIKNLKQQKEITKLKGELQAARPKPIQPIDIFGAQKPININTEDIYKI
ncbi:MAG TPA: hypothetical protein VMV95_02935, partial [Bacillota bacterium]|nr:hypothetical protein [Bacillota bacterium]